MNIEKRNFVIITGISGAGKSLALKCLEDFGFFCVDNLPVSLIPKFVEIFLNSPQAMPKVALGVDIRSGAHLNDLIKILDNLEKNKFPLQILFLDADEEILIRRYSETRHKHPLIKRGWNLTRAIRKEKELMSVLRKKADKIVDTSHLSPVEFKQQIRDALKIKAKSAMQISLVSFGYKYGIPLESDIVIDTRFLPNPQYRDDLREFSGEDKKVVEYIMSKRITRNFLKKLISFLNSIIPYYIKEGKSNLTISIGCTGGRHRSIVVANYLAKFLSGEGYQVQVEHRDIKTKIRI